MMKKYLLAIFVAGVWINISEFVRNEWVIKHLWVEGFNEIGLSFPANPINGLIWGLWSFIFAIVLTWLISNFDVLRGTVIAWVMSFVLAWIAMWNMGILPSGLLYWAVPWSFAEVYIAAVLCRYFLKTNKRSH